jgi:hypothetical protein
MHPPNYQYKQTDLPKAGNANYNDMSNTQATI